MPLNIADLVAKPGYAPSDSQSDAPLFGRKPAVGRSEDLDRIVALPRRDPPSGPALVQYMQPRLARVNDACVCREVYNRDCIRSVNEVQAWALYEIAVHGGLTGPIGVGHGKTLLDILASLVMPQCLHALLLIPPTLMEQFEFDYKHCSEHFYVPRMVMVGGSSKRYLEGSSIRKGSDAIRKDSPILHVFPYSRLSRHTATDFIETVKPDTIIADESHKLSHEDTATTSRVKRYIEEDHPECRFLHWSGSMTGKSVKDHAHLCKWSLREGSPLPRKKSTVEEWHSALDPDQEWTAPIGELKRLCHPGEHIYSGIRRRFVETPGVVSTTESAIDAQLVIKEREAPPIPDQLSEAMDKVRDSMERPDGEWFVDQFAVDACLRQLACGFWYKWIFPRGEEPELVDEWRDKRKGWHGELRQKLKKREVHLDSELLCTRAAIRYHGGELDEHLPEDYEGPRESKSTLPEWDAMTWLPWRDIKDKVRPVTVPVWVSDYLVKDSTAWSKDHRGIIWYEQTAYGAAVSTDSGLPFHDGGPKAGERLAAEKGDRSIVASIKSHGTGRNGLQFLYYQQLVANPMSSATGWEQLLGRLLRIGQKSPKVETWFYRHTPELRKHVDRALARAFYVQGTLGSAQKLLMGFATSSDD